MCILCFTKEKNFDQFQLQMKVSLNYLKSKMHSSTQTDDREEEGISVVMFTFLSIQKKMGFRLLFIAH